MEPHIANHYLHIINIQKKMPNFIGPLKQYKVVTSLWRGSLFFYYIDLLQHLLAIDFLVFIIIFY